MSEQLGNKDGGTHGKKTGWGASGRVVVGKRRGGFELGGARARPFKYSQHLLSIEIHSAARRPGLRSPHSCPASYGAPRPPIPACIVQRTSLRSTKEIALGQFQPQRKVERAFEAEGRHTPCPGRRRPLLVPGVPAVNRKMPGRGSRLATRLCSVLSNAGQLGSRCSQFTPATLRFATLSRPHAVLFFAMPLGLSTYHSALLNTPIFFSRGYVAHLVTPRDQQARLSARPRGLQSTFWLPPSVNKPPPA